MPAAITALERKRPFTQSRNMDDIKTLQEIHDKIRAKGEAITYRETKACQSIMQAIVDLTPEPVET